MSRILIGFRACRQNIAGNQNIITFTDNYVAFQIQGFHRRKQKKVKSLLKGSLAVLESLRLQRGTRKISSYINGISDQILSQTPVVT